MSAKVTTSYNEIDLDEVKRMVDEWEHPVILRNVIKSLLIREDKLTKRIDIIESTNNDLKRQLQETRVKLENTNYASRKRSRMLSEVMNLIDDKNHPAYQYLKKNHKNTIIKEKFL